MLGKFHIFIFIHINKMLGVSFHKNRRQNKNKMLGNQKENKGFSFK